MSHRTNYGKATFYVDIASLREFKAICALVGTSQSNVIDSFIKSHVERNRSTCFGAFQSEGRAREEETSLGGETDGTAE